MNRHASLFHRPTARRPSPRAFGRRHRVPLSSLDVRHVPIRHIHVVYFANLYVNPEHGVHFVRDHFVLILDLPLWTFLHHRVDRTVVQWSIVISGPPSSRAETAAMIAALFPSVESVGLIYTTDNCHELPGLAVLWRAAHYQYTDGVSLYFHAKGISRCARPPPVNHLLTTTVLHPTALHVLEHLQGIDRVGMTNAAHGFMWYNFFWIRNRFAARLERPRRVARRHYYEDWSCRVLHQPEAPDHAATASECWSRAEERETPYEDCGRYACTAANCFALRGSRPPRWTNVGAAFDPPQALGWA